MMHVARISVKAKQQCRFGFWKASLAYADERGFLISCGVALIKSSASGELKMIHRTMEVL